jgi:hypothetical protein
MKRFQYDIVLYPASAFQQLIYFCTSDGECQEELGPASLTERLTQLLNERGRDGWELVDVVPSRNGIMSFWKREID